jgi:cullin-4
LTGRPQNDVERIVKDAAHDDTMIERLVALKAFAGAVATRAFQPGTPVPGADFEYGVRAAFQGGFKARRQRPAELLAKALDRMMRRGQRGAGDAAHAAAIDALLSLHRFTDDKDVFRTFYHRLLAKRLLLERSASDDFEKSVIKKLNDRACARRRSLAWEGRADAAPQTMTQSSTWASTCSRTSRSRAT